MDSLAHGYVQPNSDLQKWTKLFCPDLPRPQPYRACLKHLIQQLRAEGATFHLSMGLGQRYEELAGRWATILNIMPAHCVPYHHVDSIPRFFSWRNPHIYWWLLSKSSCLCSMNPHYTSIFCGWFLAKSQWCLTMFPSFPTIFFQWEWWNPPQCFPALSLSPFTLASRKRALLYEGSATLAARAAWGRSCWFLWCQTHKCQ